MTEQNAVRKKEERRAGLVFKSLIYALSLTLNITVDTATLNFLYKPLEKHTRSQQ